MLEEIMNIILNSGVSIGVVIYFIWKDAKLTQENSNILSEVKTLLTLLENKLEIDIENNYPTNQKKEEIMKAKNFKDLTEDEKNRISQLLNVNESEEALARRNYYELLNIIAAEDKNKIKDIIKDELNHTIILMQLAEKYSSNFSSEFQNINRLEKLK